MVDYSKWKDLEDSDDEGDHDFSTDPSAPPVSTDLQQQLQHLSVTDLDKLDEEIEAAKVSAVAQARNGGKGQGLGAGSETNALTQKGDLMRQQLAAMDKQRKEMDDQMRHLDQLASAGDEASVLAFFEQQGMSHQEVQRMLGGSQKDADEVLNDTAAKATADPTPELTAKTESTLGLLDDLQTVLRDDVVTQKGSQSRDPQNEEESSSSRPPHTPATNTTPSSAAAATATATTTTNATNTTATVIPEVRQKVVSVTATAATAAFAAADDDKGDGDSSSSIARRRQVMLEVFLPLLSKASDAELDIAPRSFKLRALAPALLEHPAEAAAEGAAKGAVGTVDGAAMGSPVEASLSKTAPQQQRTEYLVSTGLVETVDPSKAVAKWSKKKKCLTIRIPVVSEA